MMDFSMSFVVKIPQQFNFLSYSLEYAHTIYYYNPNRIFYELPINHQTNRIVSVFILSYTWTNLEQPHKTGAFYGFIFTYTILYKDDTFSFSILAFPLFVLYAWPCTTACYNPNSFFKNH